MRMCSVLMRRKTHERDDSPCSQQFVNNPAVLLHTCGIIIWLLVAELLLSVFVPVRRLVVTKMTTLTTDPEKGLVSVTARPVLPSPNSSQVNATNPQPSTHTPLELFQLLVGIHTPPSLTQGVTELGRAADASRRGRSDNIGLYQRAKDQERASRIAYVCTSFISNTLYLR